MRSPSHNYKHRLGDTVRLACEFRTHYFNLFDNPVIWTKSQKHESKQINIQGNIKYPFVTQKHRFEVSFKPLPPDYVFELVIRGKSPAMCSHVQPCAPTCRISYVFPLHVYRYDISSKSLHLNKLYYYK